MKIHLLIILLITFFISSNSFSQNKFEIKEIKKSYGDCEKQDAKKCATISFQYPVFSGSETNAINKLNKEILSTICFDNAKNEVLSSPTEFIENFFSDYKQFLKEQTDYIVPWTIEKKVDVLLNKNRLVCLKFEEFSFTGGAHPNTIVELKNYDLQSETFLTYDNIFIKDFRKTLNPIAEKYFRKARNLKPKENLEKAGFWFSGNKFNINENFAFNNKFMIIYFNSYEIAPYAFGPTEIEIPLIEIKNLVKPEFSFLVNK